MAPVFYCLLIILTIWLVCRAVVWMPAFYAREEQAMIQAIRSAPEGDLNEGVLPPTPMFGVLCREFFLQRPSFNWLTGVAALAIGTIAGGLWWSLPLGLPFLAWFLFGAVLVLLALVDFQIRLLPDVLTLPLIWAGLLLQLIPSTTTVGLEMAVIGAVLGYLPLWLLAHAYRLIRGREGLGMGDLKLLAAMGAWSGPWVLPQVVLLGALLAIAAFVLRYLTHKQSASLHEERPFGPWLILAYIVTVAVTLV